MSRRARLRFRIRKSGWRMTRQLRNRASRRIMAELRTALQEGNP
jgi:hypothetical protein